MQYGIGNSGGGQTHNDRYVEDNFETTSAVLREEFLQAWVSLSGRHASGGAAYYSGKSWLQVAWRRRNDGHSLQRQTRGTKDAQLPGHSHRWA